MSLQTLLSIIASSVGLVSAVWLCFGALFVKAEQIVKADDQSWNASPDIAATLISQSAEYLAGGMLLVVSFLLQIAATQAPSAILKSQCPVLLKAWFVALVAILISCLFSAPIYNLRKKVLSKKVGQIKAAR